MNQHDVLMMLIWPLVTAALNLGVHLLGKSDAGWAKALARFGTVALDLSKSKK